MRKKICLIICIVALSAVACTFHNDSNDNEFNKSSIEQSEDKEIIDSDKYYCLYRLNTNEVFYNIYNASGEVVLSEKTDKPLTIGMLNADIVDISIVMGTGLTIHRYYSVEKNLFSEEFLYVLSNLNELVAYIDVPNEQPFENRKVVIQNVFKKDVFYKEYQLDFSNIDTPVIQANFLEDGTSLQIKYLSGEKQTEVIQNLKLD